MFLRAFTVAVVLVLAGTSFRATHAAETPALDRLLPPDAVVVVGIKDAPGLVKKWGEHPLKKLWNDEQVKMFFAPLREQMDAENLDAKVRETTGKSTDELLALAKGQAVLVVGGELDKLLSLARGGAGTPTLDTPFLQVIVEIGADDKEAVADLLSRRLENMRKKAPAGTTVTDETEDYRGYSLNIIRRVRGNEQIGEEAWTIAGNLFINSPGVDSVRKTLDRIEDRPDEVLAEAPNYKQVRDKSSDSDVYLYVDLEKIVAAGLKYAEAAAQGSPNAQQVVMVVQIIKGLGLDTFRGVGLSASLGEAHTDIDLQLYYAERKGLLKLLAFDEGADLQPTFVPPGVVSASATSFNVAKFFAAIKEVLNGINPFFGGMINSQLQQMSAQLGVDIEKDLIGSIGGGVVTVQAFREPAAGEKPSIENTDAVYAIGLTDKPKFETALNAMLAQAGGELFQHRDYLGVTLHTFSQPLPIQGQGEMFISYALTDKHVLLSVGSTGLLERMIGQMQRGGKTAWDEPLVKVALAGMPTDGAVVLGYADFSALISGLLTGFKQGFQAAQLAGGQVQLPVDFNALPDAQVAAKYLGPIASGVYMNDTAFSIKYRLIHPEATR